MDPSHDCTLWMSQTDFQTQTKHLRFPGLIQWGHLRQAFQGPFHPWEDVVVLKRTESFGVGCCFTVSSRLRFLVLPHHLLAFPGTRCVDIEQPFS